MAYSSSAIIPHSFFRRIKPWSIKSKMCVFKNEPSCYKNHVDTAQSVSLPSTIIALDVTNPNSYWLLELVFRRIAGH